MFEETVKGIYKNICFSNYIIQRKVIDGIMFVLRTGCQWKMLPKEYGSGSTCHRRFQEWMQLGIFEKLWTRLLKIYDLKRGIKWSWQSLDSISVKSPLGGQ